MSNPKGTKGSASKYGLFIYFMLISIIGYPQSPIILIQEDFTDGSLNEIGAGENGINYKMAGEFSDGVGFWPPNRREGFDTALSRMLSQGKNGAWGGAVQWSVFNDPEKRDKTDMKKFYIDKYDDVVVVKFSSFADAADGHEIVHPQITLMNWNEDFAGAPHYWHDISIEADQYFQATGSPVRQLAGNVNVVRNNGAPGIRDTHYEGNNGYAAKSDLEHVYENLVIWRYKPETDKTNVELWGHRNYADYDLDVGLHNRLDNESFKKEEKYAVIDHIQFTFFRPSDAFSIIRDSVTYEEVQVGFLYALVGITNKADFNLDFMIDEADAEILKKNWNADHEVTIKKGDANNDQQVNILDANPLIAFMKDSTRNVSIVPHYDSISGEISLEMENISFFLIESTNSLSINTPYLTNIHYEKTSESDHTFGIFTSNEWNLENHNFGAVLEPGLEPSEQNIIFNYKGSMVSEGFEMNFSQQYYIEHKEVCRRSKHEVFSLNHNDKYTYRWELPPGASGESDSSSIMSSFNFVIEDGTVSVKALDKEEIKIIQHWNFHLKDRPAQSGDINGEHSVMLSAGEDDNVYTYEIDPIENADFYLWSLPNGALIVEGDSTNSITVRFLEEVKSGAIYVSGSNSCGEGEKCIPFYINTITKVNYIPDESISVYPNPFYDEIALEIPESINRIEIYIFDLSGRLLINYFHKVNFNEKKYYLEMKDFNPGIYNLVIKTDQTQVIRKIIKLNK